MSALREIYTQQIARRGYKSDAVQLAVVDKLEELRSQLIAAHSRGGLRRWLSSRTASKAGVRGLYLWGGVGRGKTWLMDLFYQSLPFPQRRRRHFHRFMHDVHAELRSLGEIEAPLEQVAERISREARVLCFDELFVSDIADAMILGGLFDALFRRGVTLVVTSNVPPRDLYKNGLQRQRFVPAIELLEKHTQTIEVGGAVDYRLRQLTQAGTYLSSDDPDTRAKLEALFSELSDEGAGPAGRATTAASVNTTGKVNTADGAAAINAAARATAIEVEGRDIPVVRAGESVVWFDFEALCEGPRSATDYIELAREYQSLIVSNVPVLDETRENAARRFISLVDELYDRNVNLVLSAAAPPRDIYRGERLRHEFERTASRLIEMQSQEYLAREHRP